MNQDEPTRIDLGEDLLEAPKGAVSIAPIPAPHEQSARDQISTARIWVEEKLLSDAKDLLWKLKRRDLLGSSKLSSSEQVEVEQLLLVIQSEELRALLNSAPRNPEKTPNVGFQDARLPSTQGGYFIAPEWLTLDTATLWDLVCALRATENLFKLRPLVAELERRFVQEASTRNQRALAEWIAEAAIDAGAPLQAVERLSVWVVDQELSNSERRPLVYWLVRAYEALGQTAAAEPWRAWLALHEGAAP